MQTCLISLLGKSSKAKLSTTILFLSFFMTFCVYPLFDSKPNMVANSVQVIPYIGGMSELNYYALCFIILYFKGNSRTLMSPAADDKDIYLPNETKNGFLENISNNWDPYRFRYDI